MTKIKSYLKEIIKLDGPVALPVIPESLQLDNQDRRQLFDASSLNRCPSFTAFFTIVGVVPFHHLTLHKLLKWLFQVSRFHGNREWGEWFVTLETVRAIRTRFLIDKGATERPFEDLTATRFRVVCRGVVLRGGGFKMFIQLVGDIGVELESVLLFTNVDLFTNLNFKI